MTAVNRKAGRMAIESYDQLAAALQARRSAGLAPGQERIADLLLRDPEGTAFRTIAQTAELAAVNQSSVVRFAQSLGLPGYAAVVGLCRAQVTQQANLVSRFDLVEGSSSDDMFAAVLHHEQENLRRTYSRIVPEVWQEAVRTLAAAPRVHVLGLRNAPASRSCWPIFWVWCGPRCSSWHRQKAGWWTSCGTSRLGMPSSQRRSGGIPQVPSKASDTPGRRGWRRSR